MRSTLNKLIVGRGQAKDTPRQSTLHARWTNFTSIWHNTYEEDAGLEKAVRLFLSLSQFLFPGMYIKHLFWRRGPLYQDFATEVFVLAKTGFPLMVMYAGWEQHPLAYWLAVWFMVETLMYIPTLIFASDLFESPRSYRRSKLLLFLNYQEVVFTFALIHFAGRSFNIPLRIGRMRCTRVSRSPSTIGFGDYYPPPAWANCSCRCNPSSTSATSRSSSTSSIKVEAEATSVAWAARRTRTTDRAAPVPRSTPRAACCACRPQARRPDIRPECGPRRGPGPLLNVAAPPFGPLRRRG